MTEDAGQDASLNELKKKVFFDLLELAGRVFLVIMYSEHAIIGDRGFIGNEKEMGLTLIFNSKMRFLWEGDIIEARLSFNGRVQKCIIPADNIIAIYSPELRTQFMTTQTPQPAEDEDTETISDENVIKVDFTKKKKE
ncbi:MAG: hypothetical protein HQK91_06885 [Nitrospirae bacterium]|nr:hypothetical protein [Nitrospirota bacterium]